MSRTPTSDLNELLKLLRRILVLAVAAYGLATEMPYLTLVFRVAVLWAILYVTSGAVDVLFRRLSHRAAIIRQENNSVTAATTGNLPAVSENRTA